MGFPLALSRICVLSVIVVGLTRMGCEVPEVETMAIVILLNTC